MIKDIIEYLKEEQKNNKTEYDKISLVEEAYNNGNMEQVVNYFFEKFGQNFRAILDFCMQKGIIPDCSSEKEEQFIDTYIKLSPKRENNVISSLDEMVLVRKTDFAPEHDKIIPSIKVATSSRPVTINLGESFYETDIVCNTGHTTVHFSMNQEVLPHKDAPEGWSNCKFIILQPMTEKLYQSAVELEPLDTFFYGEVELDDYIVICDSLDSAKELILKNKKAIPIVANKVKFNGFGNKILRCMNIICPYVDYNGQWLDGTVPVTNYYSHELAKSHPRFISDRIHATNHPMHNFSDGIYSFSYSLEKIDKIVQLIGNDRTFEEAIQILDSNNNHLDSIYYNLSYAEMLPDKYREDGYFFDFLIHCVNNQNLDAQMIFEKMCSGIEINESNINQFKKVKEYVINYINNFKIKIMDNMYRKDEYFSELAYRLVYLNKVIKTDIMKLPIDKTDIYDVPIEWYDLGSIEYQTKQVISQGLENGETFENACSNIFKNLKIVIPDFPLQRPLSNDFVSRSENICHMSDSKSNDDFDDVFMIELEWLIPLFNNGQHISESDIENINRLVIYTVILEQKKLLELNTSRHK